MLKYTYLILLKNLYIPIREAFVFFENRFGKDSFDNAPIALSNPDWLVPTEKFGKVPGIIFVPKEAAIVESVEELLESDLELDLELDLESGLESVLEESADNLFEINLIKSINLFNTFHATIQIINPTIYFTAV